jgi:hypothetical protein
MQDENKAALWELVRLFKTSALKSLKTLNAFNSGFYLGEVEKEKYTSETMPDEITTAYLLGLRFNGAAEAVIAKVLPVLIDMVAEFLLGLAAAWLSGLAAKKTKK